jgi:hypothetical protein
LGDLKQVIDALAQLDGKRTTILIVAEGPPGPNSDAPFSGKAMSVGGGQNDQYICEAFVDSEERDLATMLVDPSVPRSKEMLEVNRGQPGRWPRHLVVGRALVERALGMFVKTGELDRDLSWFRTDENYL